MPLVQAELAPALPSSRDTALVCGELARHFPRLPLHISYARAPLPIAELDTESWADPDSDLLAFDRVVHQAESLARKTGELVALRLTGRQPAPWLHAAREIVRRYQRLFARCNAHTAGATFDQVLRSHRRLHDLSQPLVRADYDHALDVWQWILVLEPQASLALQTASLFHDIERLVSEPEQRVEQQAADYQRFKERHAARGAELMLGALSDVGLNERDLLRASELVLRHECTSLDPELALLNDADALSFFALNCAGFLAYFGPEHTRKKVHYTLRRMRPSARALLGELRLPTKVATMIGELSQQA
jgi:hypothetical protein